MATHRIQHDRGGIFFCTFTCYRWLPLIEHTDSYDRVYSWMEMAREQHFRVLSFVIMPNHFHGVFHVPEGVSVNKLLANGKRFLAYDIISRLKAKDDQETLGMLQAAVRPGDAVRGQKHRVFRTSSDIRECLSRNMVQQKVDYIHANPVSKNWTLAGSPADYPHSSAGFYERGEPHGDWLTHYHEVW
ncbi:MAG TPA: hypothetical protein PKD45_04515 [Flavobacteriales bacterium]|nr:hypothetical protein [Flavobacteriales bacterium]